MHFNDGRFSLSGEPRRRRVPALVDLEVKQKAVYAVRTVSGMDHAAFSTARSSFCAEAGCVGLFRHLAAVTLGPGHHRLMVRCAHDEAQGHLYLSASRLDGSRPEIAFRLRAGLLRTLARRFTGREARRQRRLTRRPRRTKGLEDEAGPRSPRSSPARFALARP